MNLGGTNVDFILLIFVLFLLLALASFFIWVFKRIKRKYKYAIFAILLVLFLAFALTYIPHSIVNISPSDVSKIHVFDGTTGYELEITDKTYINHIINNLNDVTFQKGKLSFLSMGSSFRTTIYNQKGKEIKRLIINSSDSVKYRGFFRHSIDGLIDYDYIKNLFNKYKKANLSLSKAEKEIIGEYLNNEIMSPVFNGEVFSAFEVFGSNINRNEIYLWALLQEHYEKDGVNQKGTGISVPLVLKANMNHEHFEILEHSMPRDGSNYSKDIKTLFPVEFHSQLADFQMNRIEDLQKRIEQQVGNSDEELLLTKTSEIYTFLENQQWEEISEFLHPNEEKGLTFSFYASLGSEGNHQVALTKHELVYGDRNTEYIWGYDNADQEFIATLTKYLDTYLLKYSQRSDGENALEVNYKYITFNDSKVSSGGTMNTIHTYYPESKYVEYYSPAPSEDKFYQWQALRFVYEEYDSKWYLVAIVRDVHHP